MINEAKINDAIEVLDRSGKVELANAVRVLMVQAGGARIALPPLPAYGVVGKQWAVGYTADQMREYARAAMSTTTTCKECGSKELTWHTSIVNRSNVQQGRLNTGDVECIFFLGCDHCSETLQTLSADKVAQVLQSQIGKPQ